MTHWLSKFYLCTTNVRCEPRWWHDRWLPFTIVVILGTSFYFCTMTAVVNSQLLDIMKVSDLIFFSVFICIFMSSSHIFMSYAHNMVTSKQEKAFCVLECAAVAGQEGMIHQCWSGLYNLVSGVELFDGIHCGEELPRSHWSSPWSLFAQLFGLFHFTYLELLSWTLSNGNLIIFFI